MPKLRNRSGSTDESVDDKYPDDAECKDNTIAVSPRKHTTDTDLCLDVDDIYQFNVVYTYLRSGIQHSYYAVRPMAYQTFQATNIYLFWILLHYLSGQMYAYYCTPDHLKGFLVSPFMASSPHCKAIRWTLYNGGNAIDNMWIILATWLCSKVIISF